jgi:two-component system nitrate/nitrite response regulator NarL
VSRAADLDPDLVLLDLRMPNDDGLATLKALRQQAPQVAVVMLTTSDDENDLVRTLRAGAQGYLLKDMEPDELVDCLKSVADGTTIVAPVMTAALAKVVQGELLPDVPVRFSDLTERELEILHYLAEGLSNKAIARELGIVDGTVKLHVRALLKKLGIRSRVEAAILALEEGLSRRNT